MAAQAAGVAADETTLSYSKKTARMKLAVILVVEAEVLRWSNKRFFRTFGAKMRVKL